MFACKNVQTAAALLDLESCCKQAKLPFSESPWREQIDSKNNGTELASYCDLCAKYCRYCRHGETCLEEYIALYKEQQLLAQDEKFLKKLVRGRRLCTRGQRMRTGRPRGSTDGRWRWNASSVASHGCPGAFGRGLRKKMDDSSLKACYIDEETEAHTWKSPPPITKPLCKKHPNMSPDNTSFNSKIKRFIYWMIWGEDSMPWERGLAPSKREWKK